MKINNFHRNIFYASLFAISMAYLESSIVVYLRELYYPNGFDFPLKNIPLHILLTEIGREAATIVLLFAYAKSMGKNGREVFAYFALTFGIWDIWYYIWLKLLIHWPVTLLDWDVLFLIPLPWFGPVLAPVIVSLGLIGAGYTILRGEYLQKPVILKKADWIVEVLAGIIIISSFIKGTDALRTDFIPEQYSWWLFFAGFLPGLGLFIYRVLKK